MENIFKKNPFILFLPFLVIYILIVLIFSNTQLTGDEDRYLMYAENLTKGFYSPPAPGIDLGNGPGYSLIITPLIALNLPLIFIKLLNAVFYYLSVVLLFKSLEKFSSFRLSAIVTLFWAIYPMSFEKMTSVLPEALAASLIPLILFFTINAFKHTDHKKARKHILFAGIAIGYLALVKPIFGYVIMAMITGTFVLFLIKRRNINYRKSLVLIIVAFLTTTPYLAYTYRLTGKMFYWSSFGGNNLYWMSSPDKEEYGDWMPFPPSSLDLYRIAGGDSLIILRHQKDFDALLENKKVREANIRDGGMIPNLTNGVAQDDLLKEIAIQNIKAHPIKFLQNIISNIGRMVFNYPNSYTLQKPSMLSRLPVNGILVVISLFSLIPTFLNWRKIMYPVRFLLVFSMIYFGGSSLGSADPRMFTVIVPVLLVWMAYILPKSIFLKLNW